MGKNPSGLTLSAELRSHRKKARLSQAMLAESAELSERTVRTLEKGHGSIESLGAALRALKLTLHGRNLPGGDSLGSQIATLRRRRKLSQSDLAELCQASKPTIGALEREARGRLSTLERVLSVLGAGAYLLPHDSAVPFFTHAGNSSVSDTWETPRELLRALYGVFTFDLDPCAPRQSRPVVKARVRYTVEDDGLSLPWHGTVFVNPPYGRTLSLWIAKCREEAESGRARVVALLPARPDTRYWHECIAGKATVYFLRGRLQFNDCGQSAPFASALVLWEVGDKDLSDLDKALPGAWRTR